MKNTIGKRLLCGLLTLVMVLSLVPVTAAAADIIDSGDCGAEGANVQWTLDADGTMTISGTGAMRKYYGGEERPWESYQNQIKKVIAKSGVTAIGSKAFSGSSVERVELANTVVEIGSYAFEACKELSLVILEGVETIGKCAFYVSGGRPTVILPKSLTTIKESAFLSCICNGYYVGTEAQWDNITVENGNTDLTNRLVTGVIKTNDGHYCKYKGTCKASLGQDGVKAHYACVLCPERFTDQSCTTKATDASLRIAAVAGITLSQTSFVYDGEPKYPDVTVEDTDGNVLVESKDYDVAYNISGFGLPAGGDFRTRSTSSEPIQPGTYPLFVIGRGNYSFCEKREYTITEATEPPETTVAPETPEVKKTVKKVALSATTYTYNGKVKTPAVTVVDTDGKVLVKNRDYTVTYASGRKYVGKYKVLVKGMGDYSFTKSLYFKIIPTKTALTKLTAKSKSFVAQWSKKTDQVTGYQVQYSLKKDFSSGVKTVTVSKNSVVSKTIKRLKAGRSYYVRIRTYKTARGVNYYSGWSKVLRVKTK